MRVCVCIYKISLSMSPLSDYDNVVSVSLIWKRDHWILSPHSYLALIHSLTSIRSQHNNIRFIIPKLNLTKLLAKKRRHTILFLFKAFDY